MFDNKLINYFEEMEDHDNSYIGLAFRLINNFFYGIWMIMIIIIIMAIFGAVCFLLLGLPALAVQYFEEGHNILGTIFSIGSITVYGTALRMT